MRKKDRCEPTTTNVMNVLHLKKEGNIHNDKPEPTPSNLGEYKPGKTYAYTPVDISGEYINGYLYYSLITHQTGEMDPETRQVSHAMVIRVIRSDGKLLDYRELPRLECPGALPEPIHALSDGTVISSIPKVSKAASWHWDHIQLWLEGKANVRPLCTIVEELIVILRGQVWLQDEDDYVVLALVVVVTYVQTVFKAVPLILATGPMGSGKTQLAETMTYLCANGTMLGGTSAAAIVRCMDETRGFLVIDDIERLSRTMKGVSEDLLEILKLSYKKSTAYKMVTDPRNMRPQRLSFYGVKLLTNTTGVEEILGDRIIFISTRKAAGGLFSKQDINPGRTDELRCELHAWAMDHARKVETVYSLYHMNDRSSEIMAPLRAIAEMCEESSSQFLEAIDRTVQKREIGKRSKDCPMSLLTEAVLSLARQGYSSVCMQHVILEMMLISPPYLMKKHHAAEIPWWRKPAEVRKKLFSIGFIPRSTDKRFRPYGRVGLVREYPLKEVVFRNIEERDPGALSRIDKFYEGKDFCRRHSTCRQCPYGILDCKIRHKTA